MLAPVVPLAAIRQPAFLYDADRRVVAANDLAEALAGRPLAGCTVGEIVATFSNRHPDGTPFVPGTLPPTRALAGEEQVDVPMVVTAADGRILRLLVTASPIRDGDAIAGALVIWQDVTGEMEAARTLAAQSEALHVSLERLAFGQQAARTGFWDWDVATGRLTWSPEFYDLFGLDPAAPASFDTWLAVLHAEDREAALATIDQSMEERVPLENEYRVVLPDGRVRWIGAYGDTTYDASGNPLRMAGICVDITARREAETALRKSEERYRELVENANSAIIRWRADGSVTFANDYALALFGYAADEMIGRNVDLIVPARDSAGADLSGLVAEIVAHPEQRQTNVNENVRADGTRLWMVWTNTAILDEHGAVAEILSVGMDITARRTAEEAVAGLERESRARLAELEAVYDAAPIGLAVLDRDLRYVRINRVLAAINGLPVEAHLGRTVMELVPAVAERIEEAVRHVLETGETVQDVAISATPPDGPPVQLLTQWAPVRDEQGGITGVTVATVDITELKQTESALRETAARLQEALDSPLTGFAYCEIVTGPSGSPVDFVYLDVNTTFEAFTGLSRERVLGRRVTEILVPEEVAELIQLYGRVALSGEPTTFQYPIPSLGKWYEVAAFSPRRGQFIAYFTDITERKEAEEAMREYAENLQRSNDDLQRFAYVASHDLQEPLRSIISFSQLLERRYRGQLGEDADEFIDFIVEGGTRMQGLILDLLAYSRVNTTRQQIARTDAEDVYAEAVRSLDVSLREADATLTHDPLPAVMADPTQLAQVFANLISNAVKFRKPDVPLRIHIGARRLDGFWELSVADNGIGIDKEYFDRIFVIFQRLHTKETYPGTGIGLAIVKRIIDRHGGRIRVESTPGEGSTFYFTLPAA